LSVRGSSWRPVFNQAKTVKIHETIDRWPIVNMRTQL
jgi:hypothetical protein